MGLLRRIQNTVIKETVKVVCGVILSQVVPLLQPYLAGLIHTSGKAQSFPGSYATRRGEHRCEMLPDSSKVCLNTDTQIRFNFNGNARYVEVLNGEVYFVVQNDRRPFEVLSGGALIHDVSTVFEVYKKRDSTLVTVVQGRVRVVGPIDVESRLKFELGEAGSSWKTAPELQKYQQVEFDEATRTLKPRPMLAEWRVSQLLAWQDGRIDLTGRRLSEALDEFARYQPISKFRYPASIGRLIVNGDLGFGNLDDFLEDLEKELHIYHTKTGTDEAAVVTLTLQPTVGSRTKNK
jgi:ferric-dicitrate binding protein FerR (iron transport regulator)